MNLRKKRDGHRPQSRIEKRVSMISTPDLVAWMEQSMFTIGKHISSWQRTQSTDDLAEVKLGAEVFHAIAQELERRSL